MTPPTWTSSTDPAIRELQQFSTKLVMNIAEQLNATKARFQKSLGEVSTKITALQAAVEDAKRRQEEIAAGVVPNTDVITPEIVGLVGELADLAARFDDLVPDDAPVSATEPEVPAATEPPGE